MQALRVFSVVPKLPPRLEVLWDIAYNLWFSWNDDLTNIFTSIDHGLWTECDQNPIKLLNRLPQRRIEELARDDFFLQRLGDAKRSLEHYLARRHSAFKFPALPDRNMAVAYFSLEYGIAMCLPIYSGGLGVLAGDHLKSASDLNVPLVAVGLLYREGYFRQYMTPDGWQQERYPDHDFEQMPLKPAHDALGNQLRICVDLAGQSLCARLWEAHVGKVRLFLLDTNLPENTPEFPAGYSIISLTASIDSLSRMSEERRFCRPASGMRESTSRLTCSMKAVTLVQISWPLGVRLSR